MKIAMISTPVVTTPPDGYGGLERIVWDLTNELIGLGHKVVLYGAEGSKVPTGGFTVESSKLCDDPINANWIEKEKQMWNVYDKTLDDFDIIHGHNWFGFEYASKVRNPELRVCHTHHGYMSINWWCKSKPPFKTNMFAISDHMKAVNESIEYPSITIYNGIDLDKYEFKKDKNDRLLFVGRLSDIKQPDVAIKAAIKAGYEIDIVGGTIMAANQQYLQSVLDMAGDNVKFHLEASDEKKIELMQNAKALLFPSNMGEPFGLVAVEAMATGTPVIASNDGAIPEIITKDTGIICDSKNKNELVDLMTQAIKDINCKPYDCRKRASVFSKEIMAKNYERYYKEIIKGNEW